MPAKAREFSKKELDEIETLGAVLSVEQMADYYGISKQTIYRAMERQPEIMVRYKNGKAKTVKSVAGSLLDKCRQGDKICIMFYLKTQAGWRETQHVESVNTNINLSKGQLEKLSSSELQAMQAIYAKLEKLQKLEDK